MSPYEIHTTRFSSETVTISCLKLMSNSMHRGAAHVDFKVQTGVQSRLKQAYVGIKDVQFDETAYSLCVFLLILNFCVLVQLIESQTFCRERECHLVRIVTVPCFVSF